MSTSQSHSVPAPRDNRDLATEFPGTLHERLGGGAFGVYVQPCALTAACEVPASLYHGSGVFACHRCATGQPTPAPAPRPFGTLKGYGCKVVVS